LMMWLSLASRNRQDNKIGWEKKKRKCFSFSVFQPDPLEHWVYHCHAPTTQR
jgi:hypothetical protein